MNGEILTMLKVVTCCVTNSWSLSLSLLTQIFWALISSSSKTWVIVLRERERQRQRAQEREIEQEREECRVQERERERDGGKKERGRGEVKRYRGRDFRKIETEIRKNRQLCFAWIWCKFCIEKRTETFPNYYKILPKIITVVIKLQKNMTA